MLQYRGLTAALALTLSTWGAFAQKGTGPLKVFVLAGQSNMEGFGTHGATASEKGTLKWVVAQEGIKDSFPSLIDKNRRWLILEDNGAYRVRSDVWFYSKRTDAETVLKGGLTVGMGFSKDHIGPEFGFGHVMGEYLPNQVLLIKVARGGKSLFKDFLPPRLGKYPTPTKTGDPGYWYKRVVDDTKHVLANLKTLYPEYAGEAVDLAGFAWHQGWNDGESDASAKAYEANMIAFISEIRQDLGKPELPFGIAVSGFNGFKNTGLDLWQDRLANIVLPAQFAAARKSTNAYAVDTRPFWRTSAQSPNNNSADYHWHLNAETYFLIGNGLGEGMKKLIGSPTAVRLTIAEPGHRPAVTWARGWEILLQPGRAVDVRGRSALLPGLAERHHLADDQQGR